MNSNEVTGWAFGRVSLWGRVAEHETGWRAEQAYPYELTVYGPSEVARTIRNLYGVDVETRPADELPQAPEEEEKEKPAAPDIAAISARVDRLLAILSPRKATPVPPAPRERLWDVIHRDELGKQRKHKDQLQFIEWELGKSVRENDSPVTTRTLAADIMRRAGANGEHECNSSEVGTLGSFLYTLAMAGAVLRLQRGPGARLWTHCLTPPEGFREDDPRLAHLERDMAMLFALGRAGGGECPVLAKAIVAELSAELGEPQRSQNWSGSFVRLDQRGWVTCEARSYRLSAAGAAIVRLGRLPTPWRGYEDESLMYDEVLRELEAAVAAAGDAVTVDEFRRRFKNGQWGAPSGHQVAQRLLQLERRGLVEKERRTNAVLLHWRPLAVPEIAA